MIDFSGRTYRELLASQLGRVPNDVDKREGSLIQTALGPETYALEEAYLDLDRVQKNAYALTAEGRFLDYKVAEAGLARYPASPAVRLGLFNRDVPVGSRFSTNQGPDALVFRAEERLGLGRFRMVCETPGAVGNAYVGSLIAVTFVQGLSTAELTDILVPGDDAETDGELRARYLEYLNNKPFGGNVADYRQNILAMDGVGGVQIYPTWNGGGTVKCSVLGADLLPAPAALVDAVQTAVDPEENGGLGYGLAPIGAKVTVCAPQRVEVAVDAVVTPAPGCTVQQLEGGIRSELEVCLETARRAWDTPVVPRTTRYATILYRARILSAILAAQGVVNVTGLLLNGRDEDLALEESGRFQGLPVLGTVTLHGA